MNEAQPTVITFQAHIVVAEDVDGIHLVNFADQEPVPQHYLMLQRSHEADGQDAQLGMDTYHIERDGQDRSCYGGVRRFVLHPYGASVTFTPAGSAHLAADRLEITFTLSPFQFENLRSQLRRIFAGTDVLLERSSPATDFST
jgi:hypothetical protein